MTEDMYKPWAPSRGASPVAAAPPSVLVRDAIKLIQIAGWHLAATRGSHRQYKHPTKKGRVTIAGTPADELGPGALAVMMKRANLKGPH